MEKKKTLSLVEAAEWLGVSRGFAYREARKGTLPGVIRIGRLFRVSRRVVEDCVANGMATAAKGGSR
jgi:excisionase family DNA binding protein